MLAFDTKVDENETIVRACLDRYQALAIEAEAISWSSISLGDLTASESPVIRTEGRLDWIMGRDTSATALVTVFSRMADEAWKVHVLAPMERLGEAHGELRGAPIRLQGWWIDGGDVHFGRPEIP